MNGEVYLIPGLGADKRVFEHVPFPNSKVKIVEWIPPHKNESLENYAGRIKEQIPENAAVIIGVSFGGMIAVEINKLRNIGKVILISSAVNSTFLPPAVKLIGKSGIVNFIPPILFNWPNQLIHFLFGSKTSQHRQLLNTIIAETDPEFAKWAISSMAKWSYTGTSKNIISIHGDKDRLIPYATADYKIKGGGHFMIVNKGDEIGRLLSELIR